MLNSVQRRGKEFSCSTRAWWARAGALPWSKLGPKCEVADASFQHQNSKSTMHGAVPFGARRGVERAKGARSLVGRASIDALGADRVDNALQGTKSASTPDHMLWCWTRLSRQLIHRRAHHSHAHMTDGSPTHAVGRSPIKPSQCDRHSADKLFLICTKFVSRHSCMPIDVTTTTRCMQ
jgi:hypothetical protein